MNDATQALAIPLVLIAIVLLFGLSHAHRRWAKRHAWFAAELVLLYGVLFAIFGRDMGLKDIFWHENPLVQLAAGVGVALFLVLLFFLTYLSEVSNRWRVGVVTDSLDRLRQLGSWLVRAPAPPLHGWPISATGRLRRYLDVMVLPLVLLLLIPGIVELIGGTGGAESGHLWYLPLGAALVLLAVHVGLLFVPDRPLVRVLHHPIRSGTIAGLAPIVVAYLLYFLAGPARFVSGGMLHLDWLITAAGAICLVLTALALVIFWTRRRLGLFLALVLAAIAVTALTNSDPYKLSFTGLEPLYESGAHVELTRSSGSGFRVVNASVAALQVAERKVEEAQKRDAEQLLERLNPSVPQLLAAGPAHSSSVPRVNIPGPYPVAAGAPRAAELPPGEEEVAAPAAPPVPAVPSALPSRSRPVPESGFSSPDPAAISTRVLEIKEIDALFQAAEDNCSEAIEKSTLPETIHESLCQRAFVRVARSENLFFLSTLLADFDEVPSYLTNLPEQEKYERAKQSLLQSRQLMNAATGDGRRALKITPDSPYALYHLGLSLLRAGHTDQKREELREASQAFRQAAERDPLLVRSRAYLGYTLAKLAAHQDTQEPERTQLQREARFELSRAASILEHLAALGMVGLERDIRSNPAVRYPEIAEAYTAFNMGILHSADRDHQKAFDGFADALRLYPGLAPAGLTTSPGGLLDDTQVLVRWRYARAAEHVRREGGQLPDAPAPKLVLLAVSGGGSVAACWAALCLREIETKYPDFPYLVRIVTGSSGGMVGAGQWIASLPTPDAPRRTPAELLRVAESISGDSLTPVVRQLVLGDLPSIFIPGDAAHDRGRELERTWEQATGGQRGLAQTFAQLSVGESEGWRPSMIVSPILVEDGTQMVISNLAVRRMPRASGLGNLGEPIQGLPGVDMEFFGVFPQAWKTLKLSTALRMNAAFPYVAPVVNLPTVPPRRVADAGYVDNYGVRLATEWIRQHEDWIAQNTSGVALVQIRAYALGRPELDEDPCFLADRPAGRLMADDVDLAALIGGGMQWLTSPLVGYTQANKAGMISRNRQKIEELHDRFQTLTGDRCFFRSFILESSVAAPLSWAIARPDRDRLEKESQSGPIQGTIDRLVQFMRDTSNPPGPSYRSRRPGIATTPTLPGGWPVAVPRESRWGLGRGR